MEEIKGKVAKSVSCRMFIPARGVLLELLCRMRSGQRSCPPEQSDTRCL